jgi:hypothetical protein
MTLLVLAVACAFGSAALASHAETAAGIMAKVAANQDRAQRMRSAFIYNQTVLIRFHRGGGKLAREELSEYTVSPTPEGTKKTRTHFLGKYARKGKLHDYYDSHYNYKDLDIDGELISDFAEDLTDDNKSRDGIAADLFPLTAKQQKQYEFRLEGEQSYKGRDVYRVTFRPLKGAGHDGGTPWEGEVLVDVRQFQPVLVTTALAKKIPLWVRTVLGTNLKHLGFKLAYEEFDEGLWFPVSYGGEFVVRAVFFYKRKISLSLSNSGFERAEVTSTVAYDDPVQ